MTPSQVRDNGDKTVSILSILMAICIHGRDTGGIVSVVESCDVRGAAPLLCLHHHQDETFQVIH